MEDTNWTVAVYRNHEEHVKAFDFANKEDAERAYAEQRDSLEQMGCGGIAEFIEDSLTTPIYETGALEGGMRGTFWEISFIPPGA